MRNLQETYRSIHNNKLNICNINKEKVEYSYGEKYENGVITNYDIMPGVILSFIEFEEVKELHSQKIASNILEINYCLKGRFECEFKNNEFVYVGEKDLAVDFVNHQYIISDFPLKLYYGIAFYIDTDVLKDKYKQYLDFFCININKIINELRLNMECYICKADEEIEHIFYEINKNKHNVDVAYMRIKFLECLKALSRIDNETSLNKEYITKNYVGIVKNIRNKMIECDYIGYSLEEIAKENNISLTLFKKHFKSIYGDTPYSYIRNYKMKKAALLIKKSEENINNIAISLGYKNASKFSKAFKDVMGITPKEYRIKCRFGAE